MKPEPTLTSLPAWWGLKLLIQISSWGEYTEKIILSSARIANGLLV